MTAKKYFWEDLDLPVNENEEVAFFKKVLSLLDEGQEVGWSVQSPGVQYAKFSIKKENSLFYVKADVEHSFWEDEVFSAAKEAAEFMVERNFYLFLGEAIFVEEEGREGRKVPYLSGYSWFKEKEG